MSTQHKRPGRSAKRRRQERALARLLLNGGFDDHRHAIIATLKQRTSQPLLPVPARQAKRPKG